MAKKLYDEALADIKSLKEVAEDNAKRAVVEAVVPRIRDLIERQLMGETAPNEQSEEELLGLAGEELETMPADPLAGASPVSGVVTVGGPQVGTSTSPCRAAAAVSPAPDGGAVLDVDVALGNSPAGVDNGSSSIAPGEVQQPPTDTRMPPPVVGQDASSHAPLPVGGEVGAIDVPEEEDEFILDMESLTRLVPMTGHKKLSLSEIVSKVRKLTARVVSVKLSQRQLVESKEFSTRVEKILTQVENTYDHVQESTITSKHRVAIEERLERLYQELNKLKESTMSKKLREADEDLDLGGGDEGAAEGGQELTIKIKGLGIDPEKLDAAQVELVGAESADEEGDDEGGDDLDLGDLGGEEGGEEDMGGEPGDEEEVLEIDESMLRREIRKMRTLRESEAVPSTKGEKPGSEEFDDFGDASEEGEPLNVKITTEADVPWGKKEDEDEPCEDESCKEADLQKEHRLQRTLRDRMSRIKVEGMKSHGNRRQQLRAAYVRAAESLKESRIRSTKITRRLEEAKGATRSNTGSRRPAESRVAEGSLRKQLEEQNLLNAKLICTNKLLQNESLTAKQKAHIIERLDEANSVNEAKSIYEKLVKSAVSGNEKLDEGKIIGSSSRATRPASTSQNLNEGFEAARWAKLAGLNK